MLVTSGRPDGRDDSPIVDRDVPYVVESRPDNEHWELIGGVTMMMAPPTHDHQRIASNLERMLNEALETHRPRSAAYQRVGLNLAPVAPDYDPEPDVAMIARRKSAIAAIRIVSTSPPRSSRRATARPSKASAMCTSGIRTAVACW